MIILGPITYKRHGGRRKRPGRLYLFNDSLMIVHPKTGGLFETIGPRCKNPLELLKAHNDIVTPMMTKTQECEAHIPLSMCRIVNVADTESKMLFLSYNILELIVKHWLDNI